MASDEQARDALATAEAKLAAVKAAVPCGTCGLFHKPETGVFYNHNRVQPEWLRAALSGGQQDG